MQIIQTKLKEHRIQLMENEVTKEQVLVDNAWNIALEKIKLPIRYVIVGEATTSFDNYIYNTVAQKTSFLFQPTRRLQKRYQLVT